MLLDSNELKKSIRDWQDGLLVEFRQGKFINFIDLGQKVCWALSRDTALPGAQPEWRTHGPLPCVKSIVVGLDIREYSRRRPEAQLFLTMFLHSCIDKAKSLLRKIYPVGSDEPRIVIQTGDGAYVVFTFLEAWNPFDWQKHLGRIDPPLPKAPFKPGIDWAAIHANPEVQAGIAQRQKEENKALPGMINQVMAFVFILNAIIQNENERKGFQTECLKEHEAIGMPAFPAECRFAISYDEVLLLLTNEALNCVGNGMVTCARILASDTGNHLLIDHQLMRALDDFGGLSELSSGVWQQRLHSALLDAVQVKTGTFRYADVFGFYSDQPLLQGLGLYHVKPRNYHIGSHNVLSVKSK